MSNSLTHPDTSNPASMNQVFDNMLVRYQIISNTTAVERKAKLNKLGDALIAFRPEIEQAMWQDFKKHPTEVSLTEIFPVSSEIKFIRKRLAGWMKPRKKASPFLLSGTRSSIRYESKGVVLILSPWNFPVTLSLVPLVAAIAAGNCVVLKPSEHTPHTSAVLQRLLHQTFQRDEVAVFTGPVETAKKLLEKPFHHIFFTGSTAVGKEIMKAAANHLSSVTLELGGKSPAIIDSTTHLKRAVRRLAWGKFINNGQICLSPDYVIVEETIRDRFVELLSDQVRTLYGEEVEKESSYCRIINEKHADRLKSYLENGGTVKQIGSPSKNTYFPPTLLLDPPLDHPVMIEEIFGPVLPVLSFADKEEVAALINRLERPLSMYLFSNKKRFIRYLIKNTRSGSIVINHNVLHYFNSHLPFGGINHSGFGSSKGFYSFREFSNERAVLDHWFAFSLTDILTPPYTKLKQQLIDLAIKWF